MYHNYLLKTTTITVADNVKGGIYNRTELDTVKTERKEGEERDPKIPVQREAFRHTDCSFC